MKAIAYLDAVKKAAHLRSDYALAKFLQVKQPTVSSYRRGRSLPDDTVCERIAAALDVPVERLIATMEAERTKDARRRAMWLKMAKAAAVVAFVVVSTHLSPAAALFPPLYIMSNIRKSRQN